MRTLKSRSKPVLVVFSVLAALQVLTGGTALADVIGAEAAGLIILFIAAVQVGMTFYVEGQVTPWQDVVAKTTPDGGVVAGPAAGESTGAPVQVVSTPNFSKGGPST